VKYSLYIKVVYYCITPCFFSCKCWLSAEYMHHDLVKSKLNYIL